MSNESSIFDASGETPQNPEGGATSSSTNTSAELDTILSSIKNERGEQKYKNINEALVALRHSQEYIPQLKNQLSERDNEINAIKEKVSKVDTLEQLVARLTQSDKVAEPTDKPVTEEVIANLVEQKLTQHQQTQMVRANQQKVSDALVKQFGAEKASELFYAKAQELGFSKDEINALAGKSPNAVLKLVGVSEAPAHRQGFTPPSSTVRSDAFNERPTTLIGRETKRVPLGATTQDFGEMMNNARGMVEELNKQGLSVDQLTDPSTFFKIMK